MPFRRAGFYFVQSDVLIRKFLHNYIHLTKFCPVRGSKVILLKTTALHWIYPGSQAPGKPLQWPGLHLNSTAPEEILAISPAVTGTGSARWFSIAWTFAEVQGTDSRRKGGRRHLIKMFFPLQEQQKGQNIVGVDCCWLLQTTDVVGATQRWRVRETEGYCVGSPLPSPEHRRAINIQ